MNSESLILLGTFSLTVISVFLLSQYEGRYNENSARVVVPIVVTAIPVLAVFLVRFITWLVSGGGIGASLQGIFLIALTYGMIVYLFLWANPDILTAFRQDRRERKAARKANTSVRKGHATVAFRTGICTELEGLVSDVGSTIQGIVEEISDSFDGLQLKTLDRMMVRPVVRISANWFISEKHLHYRDIESDVAGATIPWRSRGVLHNTVLVACDVVASVLADPDSEKVNTIKHELLHVHDNQQRYDLFGADEFFGEIEEVDQIFRHEAYHLWAEYYVIRNMVDCLNRGETNKAALSFPSFARAELQKMKGRMKSPNIVNDEEKGFEIAASTMLEVFKKWSYLVAIVHGNGMPYDDDLMRKAFDTRMQKAAEEMAQELDSLYGEYPNWNSIDRFQKLGDRFRMVYKAADLEIGISDRQTVTAKLLLSD